MEKQLCIVSHSHWDREWYLSHAEHNYRLVRFMDRLLDVLQKDEGFRTFHLDGQILILEDYLAVRPQRRALVCRLIAEGRIKIGPFYILQDEYLISGEANVRNILVGLKECEAFGTPSKTGYFPDAFGNIGQMPQILRGFGLDNAFFGRGIIPTGYANEVLGKAEEGYSEIVWEGADGSEVIGVQFVNWYHNAMEIPTQPKEACVERLQRIMEDCSLAARTPYLLGMNGCDHEPVQADLSKVFAVAKEAGLNVVHCSLEEYLEKIRPYKERFYRFKGEIEGQNGSGFNTLINTASSRVYLKQQNYTAQYLLESVAEPLSVIAEGYGVAYDADILYWTWKRLLQNHPHDSICGCGVDSVYRGMEARFTDAIDTARSLIEETGKKLAQKLCPAQGGVLAVNCTCLPKKGYAECFVDFKEGERAPVSPVLEDENGKVVPARIENLGTVRVFELPEDTFRQVYDVHRFRVRFLAEAEGASCRVYRLAEGSAAPLVRCGRRSMENETLHVRIRANGTFDVRRKGKKACAAGQNYFAEIGDKGNEYEFIRTGEAHDTRRSSARVECLYADAAEACFAVTVRLMQQNGKPVSVRSELSLRAGEPFVRVRVRFENACKNHRIRACFPCEGSAGVHRAAGQFDLTERPNVPGPRWQNENDPQRAEAFVERPFASAGGSFVALRGLHEYEIGKDGATQVTLVRGVGEMGDWFYFPTEDSQCLGECTAEYAVGVYAASEREEALLAAYDFHRPPFAAFGGCGAGEAVQASPARVYGNVVQSCLKKAEDGNGVIARVFNPFAVPQALRFAGGVRQTDLQEKADEEAQPVAAPKKIVTLRFAPAVRAENE